MNKNDIKILIGDNTPKYGVKVADNLKNHGYYAFMRENEGKAIFNSIIHDMPDIVVVDFSIRGINAISLLQKVQCIAPKIPEFIITYQSKNDYLERLATENGAACFMVNPEDTENVSSLIMLVARKFSLEMRKELVEVVTDVIRSYGIPAHLNGYSYLRSAIILAVEDEALQNNYTKKLYPSVAEKHKTTPSSVERSMRNAINVAWSKENETDLLKDNNKIKWRKEKPTSSEFIACIADTLRMRYEKNNNDEDEN